MAKKDNIKIMVGGLVLTTAVSGLILTIPSSFADVVDRIEITVPVSCSMSSTVSSEHTAEINNGNTTNNMGTTTIKTTCNDNSGYAIYAIGYTNDEYGNTVLTSSTLGSTYDILTSSTITTGTSSWAMKLATSGSSYLPIIAGSSSDTLKETGDPDFSDYQAVPEEYTKVAYFPTSTDIGTGATGSTFTTTYRAYISQTQPAGTYVGQVKYTLVHPNTAPAPTVPTTGCKTPVPNLTYMQDLNSANKASVLASMEEDKQYYLKDSRDENTYCVAKLKDGNIWMTQNLDLDIVTTTNYYTNHNTDIGWNSATNQYDTATWTAERATYATNTKIWNGLDYTDPENPTEIQNGQPGYGVDGYSQPESYDPGDLYISEEYINSWATAIKYYLSCDSGTCDTTIYDELTDNWQTFFESCDAGTVTNCDDFLQPSYTTTPVSEGAPQYHLGNYYNWSAAVAKNDTSSYDTDNTDLDQSICPANWTLPKAGNNTGNGSVTYLVN